MADARREVGRSIGTPEADCRCALVAKTGDRTSAPGAAAEPDTGAREREMFEKCLSDLRRIAGSSARAQVLAATREVCDPVSALAS